MDIVSLNYTDLRAKTAEKIKSYLALSGHNRLTVGLYIEGRFYVFGDLEEEKNLLSEFSVYANKAEKDSRKVGIAPANTCYLMPSGAQIRMYDYMADESSGWWKDLQNELV